MMSAHRSSSRSRASSADSTPKAVDPISQTLVVVTRTTSCSAERAEEICHARMAGPAIFDVSTSGVATRILRRVPNRSSSENASMIDAYAPAMPSSPATG